MVLVFTHDLSGLIDDVYILRSPPKFNNLRIYNFMLFWIFFYTLISIQDTVEFV